MGKVQKDDKDPLIVIVKTPSWKPPYALTFEYSNKLKQGAEREVTTNPLEAFERIKYYKLQNSLTEDQLLNVPNTEWKKIIYIGLLSPLGTTAEDAYRYILGLKKGYTADDVRRAYKDLSLAWHPDKIDDQDDKAYATRVFRLVQKAQEVLLQALQDKADLAVLEKKAIVK